MFHTLTCKNVTSILVEACLLYQRNNECSYILLYFIKIIIAELKKGEAEMSTVVADAGVDGDEVIKEMDALVGDLESLTLEVWNAKSHSRFEDVQADAKSYFQEKSAVLAARVRRSWNAEKKMEILRKERDEATERANNEAKEKKKETERANLQMCSNIMLQLSSFDGRAHSSKSQGKYAIAEEQNVKIALQSTGEVVQTSDDVMNIFNGLGDDDAAKFLGNAPALDVDTNAAHAIRNAAADVNFVNVKFFNKSPETIVQKWLAEVVANLLVGSGKTGAEQFEFPVEKVSAAHRKPDVSILLRSAEERKSITAVEYVIEAKPLWRKEASYESLVLDGRRQTTALLAHWMQLALSHNRDIQSAWATGASVNPLGVELLRLGIDNRSATGNSPQPFRIGLDIAKRQPMLPAGVLLYIVYDEGIESANHDWAIDCLTKEMGHYCDEHMLSHAPTTIIGDDPGTWDLSKISTWMTNNLSELDLCHNDSCTAQLNSTVHFNKNGQPSVPPKAVLALAMNSKAAFQCRNCAASRWLPAGLEAMWRVFRLPSHQEASPPLQLKSTDGSAVFTIGRYLGHGSFGTAYVTDVEHGAGDMKETIESAVLKLYHGLKPKDHKDRAEKELLALQRVRDLNCHVPRLVIDNVLTMDNSSCALVTLPAGTSSAGSNGGPKAALVVLRDVGEALQEMHGKDIFHADVRPENIILTSNSDEAYLIDFGMSHGTKDSNVVGTNLFRWSNDIKARKLDLGGLALSVAAIHNLYDGRGTPKWLFDDESDKRVCALEALNALLT